MHELRPGGPRPAMQIEDLMRHGNVSKCRQRNGFHEQALLHHLMGGLPQQAAQALMPLRSSGSSTGSSGKADSGLIRGISVSQLRISLETLHSSLGGQGAEYRRRCESQRKLAPDRIPLHHCSEDVHGKILQAYADVLFKRSRDDLKSGKVECIAIAQEPWLI